MFTKFLKKAVIVSFLFAFSLLQAQIPNGTWRDHLPMRLGSEMAVAENHVFCRMKYGGMLSYNINTGEVTQWTTNDGLCEIEITAIAYNKSTKSLVIGYKSGNIDIMTSNRLFNIPDITRKDNFPVKTINNIFMYGPDAYLACDFGIVVLNTEKQEIKDSYIFGESGGSIKTNDITIHNDTIFAATQTGLYCASIMAPNLVDYNFWNLVENQPLVNKPYESVISFHQHLIVIYNEPNQWYDKVKIRQNNQWADWPEASIGIIEKPFSNDTYLAFSGYRKIIIFDKNLNNVFEAPENWALHAIVAGNHIFSGSESIGFAKRTFENEIDTIKINAPYEPYVGQIKTYDNDVWVSGSGAIKPWAKGGIYRYNNSKWTIINHTTDTGFSKVGNTSHLAIDPLNPAHVMVGSWWYGIFEIENNKVINRYTHNNTPIFGDLAWADGAVYSVAMDFDYKGNCWFLLNFNEQPLFVFSDGQWQRPGLTNSLFKKNGIIFTDMLVTSNGQIWILTDREGIVVLKENEGSFTEKSFKLLNSDGDPYSRGYCLAEDKDGNVWVGTGSGPLQYTNTDNIFNASGVRGYHVQIPRYDGTIYADLLLKGEKINDIYIDGGNRKWFATANSGVFLITDDGQETVHNFTTRNSPLYSNDVYAVAIQENNGEVFFSTSKGLLSFMGQATGGSTDFEDVYVYPNPIYPDYSGDITIRGLVEETIVKITTISGSIVWETESLGGQAIWNGKNFDGKKVATGVYLVLLSNKDGSKTHITKLLFIN